MSQEQTPDFSGNDASNAGSYIRSVSSGVSLNPNRGQGQPSVFYDPLVLKRIENEIVPYGIIRELLDLTVGEPAKNPVETL